MGTVNVRFENSDKKQTADAVDRYEKRWLRAVLNDPRVKLFDADIKGLENAEPLYSQDMFVYFDRYNDGDPYNDERYIRNFKTVLKALREKRKAVVKFRGRTGKVHNKSVIPYNIEYSPQDDKFRLQAYARHTLWTINIARIEDCKLDEKFEKTFSYKVKKEKLVIELTDERNALERAMLHFSHWKRKQKKFQTTGIRLLCIMIKMMKRSF